MVALVARQGRELQRYTEDGDRLVVGCIPYKFEWDKPSKDSIAVDQALQVLVISAQKGQEMLFPRGGWESDESIEAAASREAMEEAGVRGNVEEELGTWSYRSKSHESRKVGTMFPLKVTEELLRWPEMGSRNRRWVTVAEAMGTCKQPWMKEALATLVDRLSSFPPHSAPSSLRIIAEQPRQESEEVEERRERMASIQDPINVPVSGKMETKSIRPTMSSAGSGGMLLLITSGMTLRCFDRLQGTLWSCCSVGMSPAAEVPLNLVFGSSVPSLLRLESTCRASTCSRKLKTVERLESESVHL